MDRCAASTHCTWICQCDLCAQRRNLDQLQNDDVDMDSSVNLEDYPESFASNLSFPPPSLSMSTGVTSDCSWPSEAHQSFNEHISGRLADHEPVTTWPDSAGIQTRIYGPEDNYICPRLSSLDPTSSDAWHVPGYRHWKDSSQIAASDAFVQKTNEPMPCSPFQVLPEQHVTNDFDNVFNALQVTTPNQEQDVSWLVNWATRYPNKYPDMEKLKSLKSLSGLSEADIIAWLREHFNNQTNSKVDSMVTDTEQTPRSQHAPRYRPKCLKSRRRFRHVLETPKPTKTFECTRRCGESFKKKGDWKRHELYNIEEWKCHICNFAPSRKDKLPKHLQECNGYYGPLKKSHCRQLLHPSARPCGFCGMQFHDWSTWLNHVAAHFEGHIPGGPWTMARWSRDIAQDFGWGENDDDDDDDDGDGDNDDDKDNRDNNEDEGGHDSSDNRAKGPDDQSTKGKGASSGGGSKGASRASRSSKSQSTGSHTSRSSTAGIETLVTEMSNLVSSATQTADLGGKPSLKRSASNIDLVTNLFEDLDEAFVDARCKQLNGHRQGFDHTVGIGHSCRTSEAPVHNPLPRKNHNTTHSVPSPSMAKRWQQTDQTRHARQYYLEKGDDVLRPTSSRRSPEMETSGPADFGGTHSKGKELNPDYEERNDVRPMRVFHTLLYENAEENESNPKPNSHRSEMHHQIRGQPDRDIHHYVRRMMVVRETCAHLWWIPINTYYNNNKVVLRPGINDHDPDARERPVLDTLEMTMERHHLYSLNITSSPRVRAFLESEQMSTSAQADEQDGERRERLRGIGRSYLPRRRNFVVVLSRQASANLTPQVASWTRITASPSRLSQAGNTGTDDDLPPLISTSDLTPTAGGLQTQPLPYIIPPSDLWHVVENALESARALDGRQTPASLFSLARLESVLAMERRLSLSAISRNVRPPSESAVTSAQTSGQTSALSTMIRPIDPDVRRYMDERQAHAIVHQSEQAFSTMVQPKIGLRQGQPADSIQRTAKVVGKRGHCLPCHCDKRNCAPHSQSMDNAGCDCHRKCFQDGRNWELSHQTRGWALKLTVLNHILRHPFMVNEVGLEGLAKLVGTYILFGQRKYGEAKASVNAPVGVEFRKCHQFTLSSHIGHDAYQKLGTANCSPSGSADKQCLLESKVSSYVGHEFTACSLQTAYACAGRDDLHAANSDGGALRKGILNAIYAPQGNHRRHTSRLEEYGDDKNHCSEDALVVCDETVRLWDAATAEIRGTLEGHSGWVNAVVFSPDGWLVASGSDDRTVRLWDAATGEARCILKGHSMEAFLVWTFSPQSQIDERATFSEVVRLGISAWRCQISALSNQVTDIIRSNLANGHWRLQASMVDDIYEVVPTGRPLREVIRAALGGLPRSSVEGEGRPREEWKAMFLKHCCRAGGSGWTSRDHLSGACRFHDHQEVSYQEELFASGNRCVNAREECFPNWEEESMKGRKDEVGWKGWRVVVKERDWEQERCGADEQRKEGRLSIEAIVDEAEEPVATGEAHGTLEGHSGSVHAIVFSPDGRLVASGSGDRTVRPWDAATGEARSTLRGHSDWVNAMVSCDGGGWTVGLICRTVSCKWPHEDKSSCSNIKARENTSKYRDAALQPRTASFDTIRKLYGVKDRTDLARFKIERFLNEPDDDFYWEIFSESSMESDTLEDNIAVVLEAQGKYETAEAMHRRTLELREKVLGPEHPDRLTSMNNLALVLVDQCEYEAAEAMHRRTLELREKVQGPGHPDMLTSVSLWVFGDLNMEVSTPDNRLPSDKDSYKAAGVASSLIPGASRRG